jgi:hypothetical protein
MSCSVLLLYPIPNWIMLWEATGYIITT